MDLKAAVLPEQIRDPFAAPAYPDHAELDLGAKFRRRRRVVGCRRRLLSGVTAHRSQHGRGGGGGHGGAKKIPARIAALVIHDFDFRAVISSILIRNLGKTRAQLT